MAVSSLVRSFKHDVSYKRALEWQAGFFDHRIRSGENWQTKADYIRANPVRQKLVSSLSPPCIPYSLTIPASILFLYCTLL